MNKSVGQLEEILRQAVLKCLGLPDDESTSRRVCTGWLDAPEFENSEDIAFVTVTPSSDPITRQRDTTWIPNGDGTAEYTETGLRVMSANFVFYGPNANEDAQTVRNRIQMPAAREFLMRSGIGLIIAGHEPVRIPEARDGQWWERADYSINFNVISSYSERIGTIESLGEIQIKS